MQSQTLVKRFSFILFLALPFLFVFPPLLWPATGGSVQNFHPSIDGSPYLSLSGSPTLPAERFHLGLGFHFAPKLLERQAGTTIETLVGENLTANFYGSFGILDWISAGLDLPVVFLVDSVHLDRLRADFTDATRDTTAALGDPRLEGKFRILDREEGNVGLAVLPFLTIPLGDGDHFVGDNSFTGGIRFAADTEPIENMEFAFNLGYTMRDAFLFPGTVTLRDDSISMGLGMNVWFNEWLAFTGQIDTSFLVRFPFERESETPAEIGGGILVKIPGIAGFQGKLGSMGGLTNGYGTPKFRILAGVSYTAGQGERKLPSHPPPPEGTSESSEPPPPPAIEVEPAAPLKEEPTAPGPVTIDKRIHFEYGQPRIQEISYQILDKVVEIIKANPEIRKIEIQGHTDGEEAPGSDLFLSQKRAQNVRSHLIEKGILPEILEIRAFGQSKPRDTNETDVGRARNRRVEFEVLE